MIAYKHEELRYEFERMIDPKLRELMDWIVVWVEEHFHRDVIVTSVARTGDPASLHCTRPVRAVDFRSTNFSEDQANELLSATNRAWLYDPSRLGRFKCLILHDVGQGEHFHAQVHRNTVFA